MLIKENTFGKNAIWIEPCAGADTPEKRQEAIQQTNEVLKKIYGEDCGHFDYTEETNRLYFHNGGGFWECEDDGHYFNISDIS